VKAAKPKKVAPKKPAAAPKAAAAKTKKAGKPRRQKKTVEELDAEMADYFQEGKNDASA
jgi:hypothetical protein